MRFKWNFRSVILFQCKIFLTKWRHILWTWLYRIQMDEGHMSYFVVISMHEIGQWAENFVVPTLWILCWWWSITLWRFSMIVWMKCRRRHHLRTLLEMHHEGVSCSFCCWSLWSWRPPSFYCSPHSSFLHSFAAWCMSQRVSLVCDSALHPQVIPPPPIGGGFSLFLQLHSIHSISDRLHPITLLIDQDAITLKHSQMTVACSWIHCGSFPSYRCSQYRWF